MMQFSLMRAANAASLRNDLSRAKEVFKIEPDEGKLSLSSRSAVHLSRNRRESADGIQATIAYPDVYVEAASVEIAKSQRGCRWASSCGPSERCLMSTK